MAGPLDPGVSGIPEGYHTRLAPRLLAPWTQDLMGLVDLARLPEGAPVLDLACGSGLVAAALPPPVRVVGADGWDEMIHLARREAPHRAWAVADFHRLPFRDGSFGAILCQQALQFADDLGMVLREARRVLRPGGSAAFATWAALDASPGFHHLRAQVAAHWGGDAAPGVEMPFSLDDPVRIRRALEDAGFVDVRIERRERILHFASPAGFLRDYVAGSYLLESLPARSVPEQQALLDGVTRALAPWTESDGLRFPIQAHLASGRAA